MIARKQGVLDFGFGEDIVCLRKVTSGREAEDDATAGKFMRLLEQNFREQRSRKFYSDALCMTTYRLNRILLERFGKSIHKLIQERLNREILRLLEKPRMPIYRICMEVGFDDYYWFTKYFKRVYGLPPLQYRKRKILGLNEHG